MDKGKHKGNAEYFPKTYEDDILKAGILLKPIDWNRDGKHDKWASERFRQDE